MIGAIIGDIVGSIYEFDNIKTKDFELFKENSHFTDDSVMTIAIGAALLECKGEYIDLYERVIKKMQEFGRKYPSAGYGRMFYDWVFSSKAIPYNSYGNGSAMRVSACGIIGKSLEEVKELSKIVTSVTHNHIESYKAAEAVSTAIFLAKTGKSMTEIKNHIKTDYYKLDQTVEELVQTYEFTESAQGTTPEALIAFFESISFEDAIRNAISIGGDSDTVAAITGAVAAAYYGVPQDIAYTAKRRLDSFLKRHLREFEKEYNAHITNKTSII